MSNSAGVLEKQRTLALPGNMDNDPSFLVESVLPSDFFCFVRIILFYACFCVRLFSLSVLAPGLHSFDFC